MSFAFLIRAETWHFEGERGLRRVVRHQHADGSVTQNGYDASGRLISTTDPAGRKTDYQIDVVTGRVGAIFSPDGRKSQLYYNRYGLLTCLIAPDGRRWDLTYDRQMRQIASSDPLGQTTQYRYADPHSGQAQQITDPRGGEQHQPHRLHRRAHALFILT